MPPVAHLLLLLLSLVCFGLSCWRALNPDWNRLISAGLTFLVASIISW